MTQLTRGNKSIGLTNSRAVEPSLPIPDFSQTPTDIINELAQKLAALEIIVERKADADQIRSLVAISDEMILLQAKDVVIAGTVTFVDLLKDWNGIDGGAVDPSITRIRGGVIQTGIILSNNWSTIAGTSFDLDNGIVTIGGSENPSLYFEDGDLFISGSITAESVILTKDKTLGQVADEAAAALPSGSFGSALDSALAAGVASIVAGFGDDFILEVGSSAVLAQHKDADINNLGSGYTGTLRTALAVNANGIAMGFNRKSDGVFVPSIVLDGTTGNVTLTGTLTAGSVITNSVTITGTGNSLETIDGRATNGQVTYEGLRTGGTTILTGVIVPTDSGALKTGTITWNATTGALTGGTGVAVTEWGIIGAASGVAKFTVNAATGDANFAGTITAGAVITNSVTITGTGNSLETIDGRATNGQVTYEGLRTGGTTILTGVIRPENTGAVAVGTITWNTTTGALTGGSGIAITEWGIIGASSGSATFSINAATGAAVFAGDISGASGTFTGAIQGAFGIFTGSQTAAGFGDYSVAGIPTDPNAKGLIGASRQSIGGEFRTFNGTALRIRVTDDGFIGSGANGTAVHVSNQTLGSLSLWIDSGRTLLQNNSNSVATLTVENSGTNYALVSGKSFNSTLLINNGDAAAAALTVSGGFISKSRVTDHVLEVWLGGVSQGVFEYEFRKI